MTDSENLDNLSPDAENKEQPETPEVAARNSAERKIIMEEDLNDPQTLAERVYQLWWRWSDFHLYVITPHINDVSPPVLLKPEIIPGSNDEYEFVYNIHDSGSRLSASKGEDMINAGMSMCKLFYTIEKMVALLVERLKSGGVSGDDEVQIAFGGHELAQRKAFESIINLPYNVVVTNFDPGAWGDRYLQNVKQISERGYGYPAESPRDVYKRALSSSSAGIKR